MRSASVLLLLLLLVSCSTLPQPRSRPLGPERERALELAERAVRDGAPDARSLVTHLLEDRPRSVNGLRLLQDLRMETEPGFVVYDAALAAHEAAPDDVADLYLLARTIPDRHRQRTLMLRCIHLDPGFFWGYYGLAVVGLALNEPQQALDFAHRALVVRPESVSARLVLAQALAALGSRSAAERMYDYLLQRDPRRDRVTLAAADLLSDEGRDEEAAAVVARGLAVRPTSLALLDREYRILRESLLPQVLVERIEKAASTTLRAAPSALPALLLRARARLALADPEGAYADLQTALRRGVRRAEVAEDLIRAAVETAHYGEAAKVYEGGLVRDWIDRSDNERRGAVRSLLHALRSAARLPGDASALAALARALSENGFDRLALFIAARALSSAPGRKSLQELQRRFASWARFLRAVRTSIRHGYSQSRGSSGGPTLSEVLRRLREDSTRILGRNVFRGVAVTSYVLAGGVARTDDPGADPAWRRHGTLLVVGRIMSQPVQGTMMRLVGTYRLRDGNGVPYRLEIGQGQSLRSFLEKGGGRLAGFTLPGWVLLNLDVIDQWDGEIRALATQARRRTYWKAADDRTRTSLWFPDGVRAWVARRYVEEGTGSVGTLLGALTHEQGHLLDADRFIPFVCHPLVGLALLWRNGFSAASIQVQLERDAQGHALATCPFPWNALLGTMSFLPYATSSPPHSVAYEQLLKKIVDEIDAHPGRYPSIDRRFNILEQLDHLGTEELRRLLKNAIG